MRDFLIYAKDYVDLNETFSEKNVINTVEGKEYVVASIEGFQLDDTTIDVQTPLKIFASEPYANSTAKYVPSLYVYSSVATAGLFVEIDRDWARTETLYLTDSYEFDTKEVITDENSLSCSFIINYTRSGADGLDDTTYNVKNRTVFFKTGSTFPRLENEGDNNLSTSEFLDAKQGTGIAQFLWGKAEAMAQMPSLKEYCTAKIVKKTSEYTTIRVSYRFKIWAGWTSDNQSDNTVLSVNNISIKTMANTVDAIETPFSYQNEVINVERKYALETNELFQADLNQNVEERLSYKTYQDIVDSYNIDRRIISFDLVNPIKVTIDDAKKFEIGIMENRYLDTDDEFTIYDEHNKYIGDFKVIQSNPIWDGAYHKIITGIFLEDAPINTVFADNSWETIDVISRLGLANKYWKIGDEKSFALTNGEEVTAQIIGFNHDILSNTGEKVGITFGFKNALGELYSMDSETISDGGWAECDMRVKNIPTILDLFPEGLKRVMKLVDKKTYMPRKSAVSTTQDKLFLFSFKEIMGTNYYNTSSYVASNNEGMQYEYYKKSIIPTPISGSEEFKILENQGVFYTINENNAFGFYNRFGEETRTNQDFYYNQNTTKGLGNRGTTSIGWYTRSPDSHGNNNNFASFSSDTDYWNGSGSTYQTILSGIVLGFCI